MAKALWVCAALVVVGVGIKVSSWRKNYLIASRTGFCTFYSPVHLTDMWWLVFSSPLLHLLALCPDSWRKHWLQLSLPWNIWKAGYEPFKTAGTDSILLACPKGNILWTCDPAIAKQLLTLPTIQVPVDLIKFHDIWGPTIGSVEGQEWKNHRKIISYGFSPTTLPAVWRNSIRQTDSLIQRWAHDDYIVKSPRVWTSRIALHVIAEVFFDTKMDWADTEEAQGRDPSQTPGIPKAILTIMLRLGVLFMTPRWLLRKLPFKIFQETQQAFSNFTDYMLGCRARVLDDLVNVEKKRNKTMLESIVIAGTLNPSDPDNKPLSKESVLGNMFFMMMAGHETAGNTLAFALLLLAMYPEYLKRVHCELDDVLGTKPRDMWSVDTDYPSLQKGFLGAVLAETMRLFHPVQFVWRTNVAETTLCDSEGRAHVVPANTLFCLDFAAAFSHPEIWPQKPITSQRKIELHHSRAVDFDPEKWMHTPEPREFPIFWPFGQGGRTCPGKPIAQVEMIAVLATLLKNYSIDLIVPESTLEKCRNDSKLAWESTRDDAIRKLQDDVEANLTIAMLKDFPIHLSRRL